MILAMLSEEQFPDEALDDERELWAHVEKFIKE